MSVYDPEAVSVQPSARQEHELELERVISGNGLEETKEVMQGLIQEYGLEEDLGHPSAELVNLTKKWLNLLGSAGYYQYRSLGLVTYSFSLGGKSIYVATRDGRIFCGFHEFARHRSLSVDDVAQLYVSTYEDNLNHAIKLNDGPAIELFKPLADYTRIKHTKHKLRLERISIEDKISSELAKMHIFLLCFTVYYFFMWSILKLDFREPIFLLFVFLSVVLHFAIFMTLIVHVLALVVPEEFLRLLPSFLRLEAKGAVTFASETWRPEEFTSEKNWLRHFKGVPTRKLILPMLSFYNILSVLAIFGTWVIFLLTSLLGLWFFSQARRARAPL